MTASQSTPLPTLSDLVALARTAGHEIMGIYEGDFQVAQKEDRSPLTEADLASHQSIIAGLKRLTPQIPLLSEESASIAFTERQQWHRYWLIDPLDGTKEFVKRNGEFTVNIALIEDHRPTMGVVYAPALDLAFSAQIGQGAFRQQGDSNPEAIQVRALGDGPIRVAGSRSHRGDSLDGFLARIGDHEIVSMGSSLKICLVADGTADLYPRLGLTSEWDTAAAQCVVEAAGGQLTDTEMRPLRYNTKESLLNPHFFVFGAASRDWSRYLNVDGP